MLVTPHTATKGRTRWRSGLLLAGDSCSSAHQAYSAQMATVSTTTSATEAAMSLGSTLEKASGGGKLISAAMTLVSYSAREL